MSDRDNHPLPKLLRTAEVAAVLGIPVSRLHRVIATLKRDHGFPTPLIGMGGRYDPVAIDAWRRRQAGLAPATFTRVDADQLTDDIARWQEELDRRSAAISAEG